MKLQDGYYSSPRWSWEILDCAMPMTFDTYSNCAHQCVYCFAFFQRAIGNSSQDYLFHKVRSVDVERIKRMFLEPDKYAGQFAWYIKARMVLQWGGLSDGFDWYERKFRKSLELLRFFREIDYPISISTKGVWFLKDQEYTEAFRDAKNIQMKYSIITTNPEHAKKLEAGTPSPEERFEALKKLKDLGVGVCTLRFRPYVLGVSDLCVEDIFEQAHKADVDSITTEFLCIESRASNVAMERYRLIGEVTGIDTFKFYKENSSAPGGLYRLNYDLKRPHFKRMEELAAKYNIPFFVSDAHHKERSAGTGCCGLPDNGPLSNINRGQYSEAIQIAKQEGKVYWKDIASKAEGLKNIPFGRAEGFNQGSSRARAKYNYMTMFDFMKHVWNTPKDPNSPARYFGGALVPAQLDEEGNIVYYFNDPYVKEGIKVESVAEMLRYRKAIEGLQRDGQKFGHVAYPICVQGGDLPPSKAELLFILNSSRLNFIVFVALSQIEKYLARYPEVDFFPMPDGLNKAEYRQFILNYAREEGWQTFWLMDININAFFADGEETDARSFLSGLESLASEYVGWGLVGTVGKRQPRKGFFINRGIKNCFLLRDRGLDFSPEATGKQDTDFSLKNLHQGWNTIKSRSYGINCPPNNAGKAEIWLSTTWGDCVSKNSSGLKIHWEMFDFPVKIRELVDENR